jgi:hypothetical protein
MLILTKNEHKDRENSQLNKNKTNRVTQIYSSSQVKDTVQPNKIDNFEIPPKIYNENIGILKFAVKDYKNTGKKIFNHIIENKRVYYD